MEFIIKRSSWFFLIKIILVLVVTVYVYSMFINPFINGGWEGALKVWSAWQALNVGFLAFASSLIAFYISRYNAEKQKQREFVAAKAFLPEALSELTSYFSQSAILYTEAYRRSSDKSDRCRTPLNSTLPVLPNDYKDVFRQCIHSAEPDVGEYLAKILSLLQVHHARLKNEYDEFSPESHMVHIPSNIMANIYCLGKLQALINRTFPFARGANKLDTSALSRDEFVTAYSVINIEIEMIDGLFEFTGRACDRITNEINQDFAPVISSENSVEETRTQESKFLLVEKKEVNLKFVFDHLRNYGIAAVLFYTGASIFNNGSLSTFLQSINGAGATIGVVVMLSAFLLAVLNFVQGMFALNAAIKLNKWVYSLIVLIMHYVLFEVFFRQVFTGIQNITS